jgi:hypothetical protein
VRALLPLLAALVLPAPAVAAPERSIYQSPLLWATINICDTAGHPDGVGVRGSMPGSGFSDETMWMRFQLQYLRASDGKWHNFAAGDSGFEEVGDGRIRRREAGETFTIAPPATGAYTLRGVVTFEWRRDGEVVRRARKRTTGGHREARGGDPRGFSAATCVLR